MDKKINYGFIPSKIEPDHYILGGSELFKLVYMPDGNWANYLPKYEPQYENFETAGCTVWGTQNAIEILIKRLYEYEPNYSERFTYILAGIRPPGGDPHKVAEVIRKNGLVNSDLLPNQTETFEDFIKPNPLTKELIDKGEEWLNQYDFGHEWLWTNNPPKQTRLNLLKEYLRYSPVCVSVTAWASDADDLYYAYNNAPNNHWCVCYGLDGESLLVFDSYDQSKKKLHPDHPIQMAKRYYIGKSTRQEKLGIIESILKWIAEQIKLLISTPPEAPKMPVVESKPPIVEEPKKRDLLNEFCLAIRDYEGKPGDLNYKNNNPGNIRGKDGKFLKFPTMEAGFEYLKNYVRRVARNEHKAYPKDCDIKQFFSVYAPANDNNNPNIYAGWVSTRLGLSTLTKIKELIV